MNDLTKQQQRSIQQDYQYTEEGSDFEAKPAPNILLPILRRWYIVLLTFILISGAGVPLVWRFVKPLYTTVGVIEVAPILTNPLTGEADKGEISNYESFMNTQARVMTSNMVLQRVADSLEGRDLEFFRSKTDTFSKLKANLLMRNPAPEPVTVLKEALADDVIVIAPARRTQLILITMKNKKPRDAEQIINAFIDGYMAVVRSSSIEGENKRLLLLVNERKVLFEKIQRQREDIQLLAKQYGADSLEGLQDMMIENVKVIQMELSNTESRRMQLQTQVELLSQGQTEFITPVEMIGIRSQTINEDVFIQQTTGRIAQLQQELLSDRQNLAETNPQIKNKAELIELLQESLAGRKEELGKEFDERIVQEMEQTNEIRLAQAKLELKRAGALEEIYKEKLSGEKDNTIKLGQLQWNIQDLREQMAFNKDEYDRYGQRIRELEFKLKLPARISVSDQASTGPAESKRNKMIIALIFGSFACGMFFAFILSKADHSLHTPDDIIRCVGIPIIGTTTSPENMDKKRLPEHIANDYQTIRANLGLLSDGQIPAIIAVTSPAMGEGKTTLSINLAMSLAKGGRRVLLIDGDFRKPDIARMLHLPKDSWGLQDVILGMKRFDEVTHTIPLTGLDVLTADRRNISSVIEQLSRPEAAECIRNISRNYDHIIIDTPPVLAAPDALLWAKIADAVVLSSLAGQTAGPDLQTTMERLAQINVRILGNVLSNVSAKHSYHRYGYDYSGGNGKSKGNGEYNNLLVSAELQSTEDSSAVS